MLDFSVLQVSPENPTFVTIAFTILCSFFLSCLIVFTYEKTSRGVSRPDHFIQGISLISIVAATVMLAIGDSLARGLGMLGALSIIRFRTTLQNPRNMVFMFAAIASGIACGVYGFLIGIVGTVGFCAAAFLLYYSPFGRSIELIGSLRFEIPRNSKAWKQVEWTISQYCPKYEMVRYKFFSRRLVIAKGQKVQEKMIEYEYKIKVQIEEDALELSQALDELGEIYNCRLSFSETNKRL